MLQEGQAAAAAAAPPEQTALTTRPAAARGNRLSLSHRPAPTFRPSLALQPGLGARRKSEPFSSATWGPAGSLGSFQPSARLCPLEEAQASRSEVASPQRPSVEAARSDSPSPSPPPAVGAAGTASSLRPLHTSLLHHQTANEPEHVAAFSTHRQGGAAAAALMEVPSGALSHMGRSVLTSAEPPQARSNSFVLPLEEREQ